MRSASGSRANNPLRAAEQSQPLTADEAEVLLAPIAGTDIVALAVSGGADSLALLDVVDRWRRGPNRPMAVVLTVDHRLRPGSDREAAGVVATAEARGMPARHLSVCDLPPDSDEAAARDARYRLLVGAARKEGASHLLLAHHRDDQAETFLIRLQRGSGIFGLAAMRPLVETDGLTLFRPFLGIPRSRLAATTAVAGRPTRWACPVRERYCRAVAAAWGSTKRLMSQGQAMRSILGRSRVTQLPGPPVQSK